MPGAREMSGVDGADRHGRGRRQDALAVFRAGLAAATGSRGFDYDSTWGYNDAVGYRAGTSQVFRLPAAESLLELPLSIMDSALFYPDRMNLTGRTALARVPAIVDNARRFGGTLVINWHDRSLAPERLWDRVYQHAARSKSDAASASGSPPRSEAVDWFRWRRSIRFTRDGDVVAGAR